MSRRALILAVGTRGDVQPYIALGRGLQAAGYETRLATAAAFAGFVRGNGVDFAPLRADYLKLMETDQGREAVGGGRNPRNGRALLRMVLPMLRDLLDDAWSAAEAGADLIIYHPKALAGYHLAERLGVPGFVSLPAPGLTPTRAFPSPLLPIGRSLGPLNRLTYGPLLWLTTQPYHGLINAWRRERLGLPPRSRFASEFTRDGRPVPRLYPYSPAVVPTPPDWDEHSVATGYWFLDSPAGWEPSAGLRDFLAAGPPPVYVGFGSMAGPEAERVTGLVVEALRQAGQRGLLATGVGGLRGAEASDRLFVLDQAPHDWLFPRVAAVVHHGGAGTTAAGLRAGKPTVICPFFGDQPFWGARVAALGAGPAPIPQRQLTAKRLADAIRQAVTDATMRERAAALGNRIRAERGVERAIQFIERHIP